MLLICLLSQRRPTELCTNDGTVLGQESANCKCPESKYCRFCAAHRVCVDAFLPFLSPFFSPPSRSPLFILKKYIKAILIWQARQKQAKGQFAHRIQICTVSTVATDHHMTGHLKRGQCK